MIKIVALLAGALLTFHAFADEHYLELRANANVYSAADRGSELLSRLRYKGDGQPQLLKLVSLTRENGYYHIEIPEIPGKSGWVYKSYVRGYDYSGQGSALKHGATELSGNSYGNCSEVFVGGQPPIAPDEVTPLCEEESGVVFFASGYSKRDNHGYWSAYRLDEEKIAEMEQNPLERPNMQFRKNPQLNDGEYIQPRHSSYTGTGWDRGHLAPNGSMAWDADAQKRSFLISNIAPQKPAMNRNIWRCFENSIREWASNSGDTYVVVGTTRGDETISSEKDSNGVKINVPSSYIAVVYRTKPAPMAIGVMVPNTDGNLDIRKFMMSVADLEKKTGYKFRLPDSIAQKEPDFDEWPTRIVRKELLGRLPSIDVQCPRVHAD